MREIPWGEDEYFDLYGSELAEPRDSVMHEAFVLETFVKELDDELRELFHLRYGERLSLRKIAKRMGFKSHWPIQVRLDILHNLAEGYINEHTTLS